MCRESKVQKRLFFASAGAPEPRYAIYVLNRGNQPKIVGFDVENHTGALQDARLRVVFFTSSGVCQAAVSAIASYRRQAEFLTVNVTVKLNWRRTTRIRRGRRRCGCVLQNAPLQNVR